MGSPSVTSASEPASSAAASPSPSPPKRLWEGFKGLSTLTKALIAVVVIVLLILCWIWMGHVTTDDAQVACHITAVAPQVPGYVVQLMINDNVPVTQGQVLLQIDPREYKAQVDQARALLDVVKAEANSAELQIALARGTTFNDTGSAAAQKESDAADYASSQAQLVQAATANLLQAKANLAAKQATSKRAQADLERYRPLLATDDVSKYQYDAVEATARVAASDLEAAQQQLAAAQQAVDIARANSNSFKARLARSQSSLLSAKAREEQVPITEATYKSALANVERAKAALEQAELNLAYTTITAPISGQVTQKTVNLGQYVSPGELLFTIVPLDRVFVTANFKETQMAKVRPGQRARVYVDTYSKWFDGTVDSIAGATGSEQALLPPQNATGNFIRVVQRIPVKVLVNLPKDPHLVLRPGMNVEATIYTR
jgi:membrane fusion protein, multidrug efflux system